MSTFSLIDNVQYPGKSFAERTADAFLTPARIGFGGQNIDVARNRIDQTHDIATKIIFGILAIFILPVTLMALAAKACFRAHPPLPGSCNMIQMSTFRDRSRDDRSVGSGDVLAPSPPVQGMEPRYGSQDITDAFKEAKAVADHTPNAPYSKKKIDFLIGQFAKDNPSMDLLHRSGRYSTRSIGGKIGYAQMEMLDTPTDSHNWTKKILERELKRNPNSRPSKIFFPVGAMQGDWRRGGVNHAILVVIEPDSLENGKANITIVNPIGMDHHKEYEDAIINAARSIYPSGRTQVTKNRVRQQYDRDGCGLHLVENMKLLKDVPDAFRFVEANGLPVRSPAEVTDIYKQNAIRAQLEKPDLQKKAFEKDHTHFHFDPAYIAV